MYVCIYTVYIYIHCIDIYILYIQYICVFVCVYIYAYIYICVYDFTIESSSLTEHGHIMLAINPDLLWGCQMQTLNGDITGEIKTQRSQIPFVKYEKDEKAMYTQN